MNAKKRKSLKEIVEKIESISEEISAILEEEETVRDNIPESFTSAIEISENACGDMEGAVDCLSDAIDYLNNITEE